MRRISTFLILVFLAGPFLVLADFASSTDLKIERGIIDLGGGQATSSNYILQTSVGAAGLGISTSTTFTVRGGFLNFFVPTPAPPPASPSPGGVPSTVSGGGGGGTGYSREVKAIVPGYSREVKAIVPSLPSGYSIDFNGDGHIDIVDLSILLFYYGARGANSSRFDLNSNGVVDFPDISILMYYWTG